MAGGHGSPERRCLRERSPRRGHATFNRS
jgi:hypothetical protein